MQARLQHALQWVQHEKAVAGHWCSVHVLHDDRFWLYLLIALVVVALIAGLISENSGVTVDQDFRYFAYPYMTY